MNTPINQTKSHLEQKLFDHYLEPAKEDLNWQGYTMIPSTYIAKFKTQGDTCQVVIGNFSDYFPLLKIGQCESHPLNGHNFDTRNKLIDYFGTRNYNSRSGEFTTKINTK